MPGFRPGIYVSRAAAKAWMAGSTPGSSPGAAMTGVPDISPIYQGGKGGSIVVLVAGVAIPQSSSSANGSGLRPARWQAAADDPV